MLPFPFTDLTTAKQRPAVVISSDAFHSLPNPEDYRLTEEDQRFAGLPKPSMAKCGKLLTIDQRLIRKTLGHLPPHTLHHLTQRLQSLLA